MTDSATHALPDARSGWRATLGDPTIVAIVLYALLAMGAAVAAYLTIFTGFARYDDEGTLLVTLKAFAHGKALYSDVYSPYGPFYYELFGGLLALSGKAVTTDLSRSAVIVLWVGTSFLYGLTAQRLTGRLTLGLAGMTVAFSVLYVLANEPMHPQVLCVLLLGAFSLLAVFGPTRHAAWAGAGGGALLAALVLTKLNLGLFALAGTALAAAFVVGPLQRRRWIRWPLAVAVVALPLILAARDLNLGWVRDMVGTDVLAMAAVVIAAWPLGSRPPEEDDGVGRWVLGAFAGFAFAFVAIMVAIVLNGSSLSDVYGGVVTEALRVRDVNMSEFPISSATVDWAVAAVAAATLCVWLRTNGSERPSPWPGALRIAAGLAIWLSITRISPVALNPSAGNPDSLAAVLAWVAVIPPAGAVEAPYKRFLRILLAALAVAETLQVYPVAGSQMGIAALMYVPVGALCFADGLASLKSWSETRGSRGLERFRVIAAVALAALAADLAINAIVRPAANGAVAYHQQKALPFAGATDLHLPQAETETYVRLVALLHAHHCTDFIGYPNIDSLYLWSGIEPPPPYAPGAWIEALDDSHQQRIVNELRASPRPCAIRSDPRAALWLGSDPIPDRPLVNYVLRDFRPVAQFGEFEFMLPKATIANP